MVYLAKSCLILPTARLLVTGNRTNVLKSIFASPFFQHGLQTRSFISKNRKDSTSPDTLSKSKKEFLDAFRKLPDHYQWSILSADRKLTKDESGFSEFWKKGFKVFRALALASASLYMAFLAMKLIGNSNSFPKVMDPSIGTLAEGVNIRFSDVQGCDEVKEELQNIVEFLKNPAKFNKLGAKLPKGALLVGEPGVGKTLLAKAVAGEANVPFIYTSGSSFDEVFVGVGSYRMRKLFQLAKLNAPCILFIDEIDSVGGSRSSSPQHPYANQTINMFLSEMDGFSPSDGVIVLGATNQRDHLDKALLRPGRFDLEIYVSPPNYEGRLALFKLYLSKVKLASSVDLQKLAHGTVGYTGADIMNMVNQAAITAGLQSDNQVRMDHLWDARDRVLMGPKRQLPKDEKSNQIAAFHEAGHAIAALYTPGSIPLHKVTIIPRGKSGGHTSFLDEVDTNYQTRQQLLAQLDVAMGGRVGEELVFGVEQVTTGASNDLERANRLAHAMVSRFGLSERLGAQVITETQLAGNQVGPSTRDAIDTEVAGLLSASLDRTRHLLSQHVDQHRRLAEALLHYETLSRDDVDAVLDGRLVVPSVQSSTAQNPSPSPSSPSTSEGPNRSDEPAEREFENSAAGSRRRRQPAPAGLSKPATAAAATVAGSSGVSPVLAQ